MKLLLLKSNQMVERTQVEQGRRSLIFSRLSTIWLNTIPPSLKIIVICEREGQFYPKCCYFDRVLGLVVPTFCL